MKRLLFTLVVLGIASTAYAQRTDFCTLTASSNLCNTMNVKLEISTGSGAPSANCVAGKEGYLDTTAHKPYLCTQTNTWTLIPTTLADLPAPSRVRSCVVAIGDPGAASALLADDNDAPRACPNDFGTDWTISTIACYADAGTPTVTPILTGGSGTSLLTGALTCGTAAWAAGTVQSTPPVVHSFSGTGATCSSTPCSIDVNITAAGGTAKYVVIKIVGSI